jgi:hypothetical protein
VSAPRIVDEQYQGDPFKKLVECNGQHYVLDEAALIEHEEVGHRLFEQSLQAEREAAMSQSLQAEREAAMRRFLGWFKP